MHRSIITYLILPVSCVAILALICTWIQQAGYGLSYQISPSMPEGWYWRHPISKIQRGNWILFTLNPPYQHYLIQHHDIPQDGWLLKEVVGMPGDKICIQHQKLFINDQPIVALSHYILNNPSIPKQTFCGTLSTDQFFVLGRYHPRSYDSRYFGAIQRQHIIGVVKPLFIYDQHQPN